MAVGGILFLTIYPFKFGLPPGVSAWKLPFRLESGFKPVGLLDDFLNVLLFVPFGFGVAGMLRSRGKSWSWTFGLAWGLGVLLSYSVEFTQYYIPYRDSGWHDVITNSTGSLLGALLFSWLGVACIELLAWTESKASAPLSRPRGAWLIFGYLAVWLVASVPLQIRTRLLNWDPNSLLVVGNLATGRGNSAWQGEVYRLEIWNKALPDNTARSITTGQPASAAPEGLVAAYDFNGANALADQRGNLPELSWSSTPKQATAEGPLVLDGKSWLTSKVPVTPLLQSIRETSQFSIHVVCRPADPRAEDRRITTLSRATGIADIDFEQNHGDLIFWFRSPLSVRHYPMAWITTDFFREKRIYDMLFVYDGTDLSFFADGQKEPRLYRMGPGTALARLIRNVKPAELEGYRYMFYALVFFPTGILLGIASRKTQALQRMGWFTAAATILIPAVILEAILVWASGRSVILSGPILCVCWAVAGMWWINLRHSATAAAKD
jgi:VanZ family protein